MSWEPGSFPNGTNETIELGRRLSVIVRCPIRLVSWTKPQFECWHNVTFDRFAVVACIESKMFDRLRWHHEQGIELMQAVKIVPSRRE